MIIDKNKILVLIPARAGSKGIPGKNWKELNGKPLILYTIEAALKCFPRNNICLSTDSNEIIQIAKQKGLEVPFIRPEELSSDTASSRDVIFHAIDNFHGNFTHILLLQPTSPFRTAEHISKALDEMKENYDMLVSVKETDANPYYVLVEENEKGFLKKSKEANVIRRQDAPIVYEFNGAIYLIRIKSLFNYSSISDFPNKKKFVMDKISSLDIDTPLDWELAEIVAKKFI
jgi:N-acylneuraminate cytidylyltransferase